MGRSSRGQYLIYIGVFIACLLIYIKFQSIQEGFDTQSAPIKGIILNLQGGLGNQLFIYAAAISFIDKYKVPVYILPTDKESNIHSSQDYRYLFNETIPIEYSDHKMNDTREVSICNNFYGPWIDIPTDTNKYILMKYHWFQDYPSLKSVIPRVKNHIISHLASKYNDLSVETTCAFIHVRRGDYTKQAGGMFTLDMEYYGAGLKVLNESPLITKYYIISDDIAWCKMQKWETDRPIEYFDEPDELRALYMMSQCEGGAVIANSTFSTWGAFLGPLLNSSSTVVYPSKWLFNGNLSLPDEWIKI